MSGGNRPRFRRCREAPRRASLCTREGVFSISWYMGYMKRDCVAVAKGEVAPSVKPTAVGSSKGTHVWAIRCGSPRFRLAAATGLYVLLLAGITGCNAVGPDRWWWGSLNLYLPQWLWGLPGLMLSAASWRWARRWMWAPALCLLWVAGPLMGFCWSPGTSAASAKGF